MKIAFVLPRFHPNMNSLVNSILDLNHEVTMIVAYEEVNEDHSRVTPTKISFFKQHSSPTKIPIINPIKLLRLLKFYDADLIIFRADRNKFTIFAIFGLIFFRRKIIVYDQYKISSNNLWVQLFIKIRNLILKPKFGLTPVWNRQLNQVPLSNLINENISEFQSRINNQLNYNDKQRLWMPFGIEEKSYISKLLWADRPIDILISSKLVKRKNLIEIMQQFQKVQNQINQPLKITLALIKRKNKNEDLYLQLLNKEISKLNNSIEININFNIAPAVMPEYFMNSKIFILLSNDEPASYSNIQAAAAGCYIYLSKSNGTSFQHPNNKQVINFLKVSSLSQEIHNMIKIESENITLLEQFRKIFIDLYSSEQLAKRLISLA
jgi:glycosyltransferase involved in cell wall biosynthesis